MLLASSDVSILFIEKLSASLPPSCPRTCRGHDAWRRHCLQINASMHCNVTCHTADALHPSLRRQCIRSVALALDNLWLIDWFTMCEPKYGYFALKVNYNTKLQQRLCWTETVRKKRWWILCMHVAAVHSCARKVSRLLIRVSISDNCNNANIKTQQNI